MYTPEFCSEISAEQARIRQRCNEIDDTKASLIEERAAIMDRVKKLEAIRDLYLSSQDKVDEATSIQRKLENSEPGADKPVRKNANVCAL